MTFGKENYFLFQQGMGTNASSGITVNDFWNRQLLKLYLKAWLKPVLRLEPFSYSYSQFKYVTNISSFFCNLNEQSFPFILKDIIFKNLEV